MEHASNLSGAAPPDLAAQIVMIVAGAEVSALEALIALGLAVVAGLVVHLVHVNRAAGQAAARDIAADLARGHMALEARLGALAESAVQGQTTLRSVLDQRLDTVAEQLGAGLAAAQARTGDSLRHLHERLALIDRAQDNIRALTDEVSGLQAILSNKQRRGAFGEIQMQDLVRTFLPASGFEFQATLSNKSRVDCLIKMPQPPGSVAVDAKFPLESWRAWQEANDPSVRETAGKAFAADVLRHVKAIAEKYLIPGETADTALLFLPSEAVYASVHGDFPDVIERAFRSRVMIVSPTTFMATLHTIRAVLRDVRLREQAQLIQREVGHLIDDVTRLDDRVGKLERHFDQAVEDVRAIRISADKVVKRSARIADAPEAAATPAERPAPLLGRGP